MKKNFHHLDLTPLLTEDIENPSVHCNRCGREYPMFDMVCGYREDEWELSWYCTHDDCYGKFPQDVYIVKITNG